MNATRRHTLMTSAIVLCTVVAAWGVAADRRTPSGREADPATIVAGSTTALRSRHGRRAATIATPSPEAPVSAATAAHPSRAVPITDRRRAAPTSVAAAPRSVQVMRVDVPASLPRGTDVQWTMQPSRRAEVLSASAGAVPSTTEEATRAVTVVTRVPATAAAGVLPVGELTFTADSMQVVVPVELVVTRIRRASVTPVRSGYSTAFGGPLTFGVEVRNLGNSVDTMTVGSELPQGWKPVPSQTVVLIPGERRTITFATRLPARDGVTTEYPVINVSIADSVTATTNLPVRVEDRASRQAAFGPQLIVGATDLLGDTVSYTPVVDLALSGPIAPGISVLGRANLPEPKGIDRQGLGRVRTNLGGPFLMVRGPAWYGTVGTIGTSLSTLTGIGSFGHGVTAGATKDQVSGSLVLLDVPDGSGAQVGARGDYRFSGSTVGVAASHLQSGGQSPRALSAASVIGTATPFKDVRTELEVGYRDYQGGSGAGVAATANHATATEVIGATFTRAPGGGQAFGPGTTSWSTVAARRFGDRFTVSANTFSSSDTPAGENSSFKANGWVIFPRYKLGPDLALELQVRRNTSDSRTETTRLDNEEFNTSLGIRRDAERLSWLVSGALVSAKRGTAVGSGPLGEFAATGFGVATSARAAFPRFIAGGAIDYSRTGEGVGAAPQQARVTATVDRVAPFNSSDAPTFHAQATHYTWFGDRAGVTIARIGADVPIGKSMSLTIDAERNPMLRSNESPTPWIVAVRLERGFTLNWLSRSPATRGAVFQDLNGNGIRDGDEGGVEGITVRRGDQSAVTDRNGRFAIRGTGNAPVEVDPLSLPRGVVAPIAAGAAASKSPELGVVPTAAVSVHLLRTADELGRTPEAGFEMLAVVAKDEHGAEWYLRADTTGTVRFDALPPGRYTFTVDFSATPERLRQVGEPVVTELHPGENFPPLEIKFTVRQARLFNGGSAQSDQGRRR